ncbi:MAG: hypothetical protein LBE12_14035, partial [Planctomycetaceae bacterium]|nr:hypothetical protein [Planctomycetaceae bacterium]
GFMRSIRTFEMFLSRFPKSSKTDDALICLIDRYRMLGNQAVLQNQLDITKKCYKRAMELCHDAWQNNKGAPYHKIIRQYAEEITKNSSQIQ